MCLEEDNSSDEMIVASEKIVTVDSPTNAREICPGSTHTSDERHSISELLGDFSFSDDDDSSGLYRSQSDLNDEVESIFNKISSDTTFFTMMA